MVLESRHERERKKKGKGDLFGERARLDRQQRMNVGWREVTMEESTGDGTEGQDRRSEASTRSSSSSSNTSSSRRLEVAAEAAGGREGNNSNDTFSCNFDSSHCNHGAREGV